MGEVLLKIKGGYFVKDGRWSHFVSDEGKTEEEMVDAIFAESITLSEALEKYK